MPGAMIAVTSERSNLYKTCANSVYPEHSDICSSTTYSPQLDSSYSLDISPVNRRSELDTDGVLAQAGYLWKAVGIRTTCISHNTLTHLGVASPSHTIVLGQRGTIESLDLYRNGGMYLMNTLVASEHRSGPASGSNTSQW